RGSAARTTRRPSASTASPPATSSPRSCSGSCATAPTTRADPADGTGQGGSAVAPGPDGLVVGPLDPRGQLLVDRDRAVGVEHLRAGGRPLPRQVPLAAVDVGPHALVDGAGL